MDCKSCRWLLPPLMLALASLGCQSPSHTGEGALAGGLIGGGAGAIIGHATGHTGAGAAIGAGVGALTGAAIGHGQDETEARNRQLIEQRLGRQVAAGAATVPDVVAMARAGVDDEIIVNHIRTHGIAAPLAPTDLMYLKQQGISPRVIETMQATGVAVVQSPPPVVYSSPPPVIVEERWGSPYHRRYYDRY